MALPLKLPSPFTISERPKFPLLPVIPLSNSKLTITSPQLLIAVDRSRFGEFDSGDLN